MRWTGPRIASVAVAVLVVATAVVVWLAWPKAKPAAPSRARQYSAFSACLLTDAAGVSGQPAATVWAGMQDASAQTRMKVSYFAVAGDRTADNIRPYVAGLVQKKCDVVVAGDSATVTTASGSAAAFPTTRFVLVGGTGGANVIPVAADAAGLRAAVAAALEGLTP